MPTTGPAKRVSCLDQQQVSASPPHCGPILPVLGLQQPLIGDVVHQVAMHDLCDGHWPLSLSPQWGQTIPTAQGHSALQLPPGFSCPWASSLRQCLQRPHGSVMAEIQWRRSEPAACSIYPIPNTWLKPAPKTKAESMGRLELLLLRGRR